MQKVKVKVNAKVLIMVADGLNKKQIEERINKEIADIITQVNSYCNSRLHVDDLVHWKLIKK